MRSARAALFASLVLTACPPAQGVKPASPVATVSDVTAQNYVMPALPKAKVTLVDAFGAPHTVDVEVAATRDSRTRGLMWRTELADGEGMLFIFRDQGELSFWMRNTLISLDMIFIDKTMHVVGIVERAEILREKGTDRSKFYRGEIDKYTWVDVGSSYLPSDILSAFLYAQFEKMDEIQQKRLAVYRAYSEALKPLAREGLLELPAVPAYASHNAHLFHILLRNRAARDEAMRRLKERGVSALFHYLPLHTSPMGHRLGYRRGDLPVTEEISDRLLRLPLYAGITREELDYVISNVRAVVEGVCESRISAAC
jgi:uncharacterized membrane protein (UPF0127 family)